jgi:hypothetical protein
MSWSSGGHERVVRPSLHPWSSTPLDRPIELGNGVSRTRLDTYLPSRVPLEKSLGTPGSTVKWPVARASGEHPLPRGGLGTVPDSTCWGMLDR